MTELPHLPAWRITLLRLCYLAIAGGLSTIVVPRLASLPEDWTSSGAVVTCFLTAMMTMCALGVMRPLAMLPVMVFELVWKFVYMFRIVPELWLNGQLGPDFEQTLWDCVPILLFVPIIPWRHVGRRILPRRAPNPA